MRKLDGCFKASFHKYLDCGVLAHGCARAACEGCKHSILIAFSCKRRALCPSCQAKRAVIFAEHLHEEVLLPHEDRQLIFTIPKRLRIYFRYDRSLLKHLYTAAWQTWQEFVRMRFPYGTPGAVMALHTAGDLLNWHPHIHTIAVNGVVADGGAFLSLSSINTACSAHDAPER